MRREWLAGYAVIVFLVAVASCRGPAGGDDRHDGGEADGGKLAVHTVNYPLQYFAQRIGGDLVSAAFPVPRDVDPAFWSPEASEIASFQKADLVLLNGAGYAKWVAHASLPPSRLVDTSAAFRERYVQIDDAVTHTHGPEGDHDHGEIAFTTWLDMQLAADQARAVAAAFERAKPVAQATFQAGLAVLEADLLELDEALRGIAQHGRRPLLGSHPVYQYLARGYGLEIASVHFEPDEFPSEAAWKELDDLNTAHGARWMLWESAPLEATVRSLEERGVASVIFDPCSNVPSSGDFLTVQRANLESLERALR